MKSSKTTAVQPVDAEGPLLVIGAGMARTGTFTLKTALEIIYGQPCYHMLEIVRNHKDHIKIWTNKFQQMQHNREHNFTPTDREYLFRGYRAITDLPGCAVYKELMAAYPNAKVILTVRDDEKWLKSIRSTVRPTRRHLEGSIFGNLVQCISVGCGFYRMADLSFLGAFGFNLDLSNDEELRKAFNDRNDEVKRTVPKDRLLVYDVASGWKPLCEFLDVPTPEQPFPHVNDAASMQKEISKLYKLLRIVQFSAFSPLVAVIAFALYKTCFRVWPRTKA